MKRTLLSGIWGFIIFLTGAALLGGLYIWATGAMLAEMMRGDPPNMHWPDKYRGREKR